MKFDFLQENGQAAADYLNLAVYGAICISMYEEEVHAAALDTYKTSAANKKDSVKDPLKLYCWLCNDYVKSHFINVDYGNKYQLMRQHHVNDESDVYLPKAEWVEHVKEQQKGDKPTGQRTPWPKSRKAFKFSPVETCDSQGIPQMRKTDDITEAIKLVGYRAAGIEGSVVGGVPDAGGFIVRAQLTLAALKAEGENYTPDLPAIFKRVNEFIDYCVDKFHPELDRNIAKQKASIAIGDFIPKLLNGTVQHPFWPKDYEHTKALE